MSDTKVSPVLEEVRVDPNEAEWLRKLMMRPEIRYRLFFKNSNANRTFMQICLIEDVMQDHGAVMGQDFVVEESQFDMAELWNRSSADAEKEKYGNSVYLTQRGLEVVRNILANESCTDFDHTFAKVTVLQERTD